MKSLFAYIRRNHSAFYLVALGLSLVFGLAYFFEAFKLGIGPEFIMKFCGKLFYLGGGIGFTLYIVRKVFPTIDAFCSRSADAEFSQFSVAFKDHPRDPRLWICVFAHGAVFLGVCLLFALAF